MSSYIAMSDEQKTENFSNNLDYLLWKKGKKKKDLASALGISDSVLTQAIKSPLRSDYRFAIAESLGVQLSPMFEERLYDRKGTDGCSSVFESDFSNQDHNDSWRESQLQKDDNYRNNKPISEYTEDDVQSVVSKLPESEPDTPIGKLKRSDYLKSSDYDWAYMEAKKIADKFPSRALTILTGMWFTVQQGILNKVTEADIDFMVSLCKKNENIQPIFLMRDICKDSEPHMIVTANILTNHYGENNANILLDEQATESVSDE